MAYSGNPTDYSIAVIYGGTSGEREVSLTSGSCCATALQSLGFSVTLIDSASRDDLRGLLDTTFDVAFLALHGKGGEDGSIQGFLETLKIPYTGSGILANAIAVNKPHAKHYYANAGLRVAPSVTVGKDDLLDKADLQDIAEAVSIPCVVKPATEGSSLGMSIVHEFSQLSEAIETALSIDDEVMIEKFIEGKELTIGILGNSNPYALPVIQVVPNSDEFYNYHAKYAEGGSTHLCPAPVSPNITQAAQEMALAAHMILGCRGVSRSDVILDAEGQCWILETNTLPGMTGTSLVPDAARVAGIEFPQLCEKLIEYALEDE